MSKSKGKRAKPWIVEVKSAVPGMTHTTRHRYEHEASARKRAAQYNSQWFAVTVRKAHA